ncbi:hypothetical protein MKZ38_008401 [Zalerion maritima]|uniref:Transmembrane protein n=1 Tax=Zalerion maritima TaxID=339359 RepID=A0AAD5RGS3_9PEZI|nr:hypothetical protein MKZ38_008401 [Zalerion maritima]
MRRHSIPLVVAAWLVILTTAPPIPRPVVVWHHSAILAADQKPLVRIRDLMASYVSGTIPGLDCCGAEDHKCGPTTYINPLSRICCRRYSHTSDILIETACNTNPEHCYSTGCCEKRTGDEETTIIRHRHQRLSTRNDHSHDDADSEHPSLTSGLMPLLWTGVSVLGLGVLYSFWWLWFTWPPREPSGETLNKREWRQLRRKYERQERMRRRNAGRTTSGYARRDTSKWNTCDHEHGRLRDGRSGWDGHSDFSIACDACRANTAKNRSRRTRTERSRRDDEHMPRGRESDREQEADYSRYLELESMDPVPRVVRDRV